MASMDEVSRPSVPIGVTKRCMLGVKRNGTASVLTNSGFDGTIAEVRRRVSWSSARPQKERERTREHVRGVHLAARSRDVDARRDSSAHAEDVGREDERRHLERHLLPDVPELARALHRLDHVLCWGEKVSVERHTRARRDARS